MHAGEDNNAGDRANRRHRSASLDPEFVARLPPSPDPGVSGPGKARSDGITPEQVKQQHLTARQLDEKQGRVVLEREKAEEIKNTFVR